MTSTLTTAKPGGGPVLLGRFPGADEPASSTDGGHMADTKYIDAGLPENFRASAVIDYDPDPSYLDQDGFEDRLAAYHRDEWSFLGVILEHECECCSEWKTVGSLWGIEDDSGDDYFVQVAKDLFEDDQAQA